MVTPALALPPQQPWTGQWVADRLGIHLHTTESAYGLELADLVGLAVRRNPRRAHLLVSTVLAKHVPTPPRLVHDSGLLLGRLAGEARIDDGPVLVLGNAETATALGHCVAEALRAPYLHSTRRGVPAVRPVGTFTEAHSHATDHQLLPADPGPLLDPATTIVLVDDELSTGATALGTIEALHRIAAHRHYILANLIDVRSADDMARSQALAAKLGTRIDAVSLVAGRVELPTDILTTAADLVSTWQLPTPADGPARCEPRAVALDWPAGVPEGGRHGLSADQTERLGSATRTAGAALAKELGGVGPVHVLGTEELMYAPLLVAEAVADRLPDREVRFSTTTRSPVLTVDTPDYAIRTGLTFVSHDEPMDGPGPRFVYNVQRAGTVVLVVDSAGNTPALHGPDGAMARLARHSRDVVLVEVPTVVPSPGNETS